MEGVGRFVVVASLGWIGRSGLDWVGFGRVGWVLNGFWVAFGWFGEGSDAFKAVARVSGRPQHNTQSEKGGFKRLILRGVLISTDVGATRMRDLAILVVTHVEKDTKRRLSVALTKARKATETLRLLTIE